MDEDDQRTVREKLTYLHDGVFVSFDGFQLWLHTNQFCDLINLKGDPCNYFQNNIALDSQTYCLLGQYVDRRVKSNG